MKKDIPTSKRLGEKRTEEVSINATEYDEEKAESIISQDVFECLRFADTREVTWIEVTGLHDPKKIAQLGRHFTYHYFNAMDGHFAGSQRRGCSGSFAPGIGYDLINYSGADQ